MADHSLFDGSITNWDGHVHTKKNVPILEKRKSRNKESTNDKSSECSVETLKDYQAFHPYLSNEQIQKSLRCLWLCIAQTHGDENIVQDEILNTDLFFLCDKIIRILELKKHVDANPYQQPTNLENESSQKINFQSFSFSIINLLNSYAQIYNLFSASSFIYMLEQVQNQILVKEGKDKYQFQEENNMPKTPINPYTSLSPKEKNTETTATVKKGKNNLNSNLTLKMKTSDFSTSMTQNDEAIKMNQQDNQVTNEYIIKPRVNPKDLFRKILKQPSKNDLRGCMIKPLEEEITNQVNDYDIDGAISMYQNRLSPVKDSKTLKSKHPKRITPLRGMEPSITNSLNAETNDSNKKIFIRNAINQGIHQSSEYGETSEENHNHVNITKTHDNQEVEKVAHTDTNENLDEVVLVCPKCSLQEAILWCTPCSTIYCEQCWKTTHDLGDKTSLRKGNINIEELLQQNQFLQSIQVHSYHTSKSSKMPLPFIARSSAKNVDIRNARFIKKKPQSRIPTNSLGIELTKDETNALRVCSNSINHLLPKKESKDNSQLEDESIMLNQKRPNPYSSSITGYANRIMLPMSSISLDCNFDESTNTSMKVYEHE